MYKILYVLLYSCTTNVCNLCVALLQESMFATIDSSPVNNFTLERYILGKSCIEGAVVVANLRK